MPRIGTNTQQRVQLRKRDMKIGTLNLLSYVRADYRTATAPKTIENLKKADIDTTAIPELRWTDNGMEWKHNWAPQSTICLWKWFRNTTKSATSCYGI